MESKNSTRIADVFVSISDPRQSTKVRHDLVGLLHPSQHWAGYSGSRCQNYVLSVKDNPLTLTDSLRDFL